MRKILLVIASFFLVATTSFADPLWFDYDGAGGDSVVLLDQLRGAARTAYFATQETDSSGDVFVGAEFTEDFVLNINEAFQYLGGVVKEYPTVAGASPLTKALWADTSILGSVNGLGAPGEYSIQFDSGTVDFYRTDAFVGPGDPTDPINGTLIGSFIVTGGGGDSVRWDNPTATLDFGVDLLATYIAEDVWFMDNSGVQGNDIYDSTVGGYFTAASDLFFFSLADSSINLLSASDIMNGDANNDPYEYYREILFSDNGTTAQFGTIPEPTTMVLFGLGLLGLAGIGRKKA